MNKSQIETVERLRHEGKWPSAIAKETGISINTIKSHLGRHTHISTAFLPQLIEQKRTNVCYNLLRVLKAVRYAITVLVTEIDSFRFHTVNANRRRFVAGISM